MSKIGQEKSYEEKKWTRLWNDSSNVTEIMAKFKNAGSILRLLPIGPLDSPPLTSRPDPVLTALIHCLLVPPRRLEFDSYSADSIPVHPAVLKIVLRIQHKREQMAVRIKIGCHEISAVNQKKGHFRCVATQSN